MKKENSDIRIEINSTKDSEYNKVFIENLYKKIINEKTNILETLELKKVRKVTIKLYNNQKDFISSIEKFYIGYKIPTYCKGTIQNGEIYFLIDTQIKENTYEYELELRKIIHEYIHILNNEYIFNSETRITWLDEGIALNLSKQRGKFLKEKYPILKSNLNKINLNKLQHEQQTFMSQNINGYDISYLTVKYLMETMSREEFNNIIRKNEKILEIRKKCMARCKKIF